MWREKRVRIGEDTLFFIGDRVYIRKFLKIARYQGNKQNVFLFCFTVARYLTEEGSAQRKPV